MKDPWTTVTLAPLTGPLDVRSQPADLPPGAWRWKESWQTTTEGKLRRRTGFERFGSGNADLHHRGTDREPINLLFESTGSDGARRLFAGTPTTLNVLDESTGDWATLATVSASPFYWKADELSDYVVFTNNQDPVMVHQLGSGTAGTLNGLVADRNITAALIAIQWSGFMIVMNVVMDGERKFNRIAWSDYKLPLQWTIGSPSLAGAQDLDPGDEILAAAPLLNALYVFTRRSIWRMTVSGDTAKTFAFDRVYNEPKNQLGCIAFRNTLVSDGGNLWYMSRDAIYNYNPYIAAPERHDRTETDWMHRASGVIYTNYNTKFDQTDCEGPIAQFRPLTKELLFSWRSHLSLGDSNDYTLTAMVERKTADVQPVGWVALVNFRQSDESGCNEEQTLLGVSGRDWCIKSIGGEVFFHEFANVTGLLTDDLPADNTYVRDGYYSIMRAMIPLGVTDRQKTIRHLEVGHDTASQDPPCVLQLRVGTSHNLADPNSNADRCAVLWTIVKELGLDGKGESNPPLACPDEMTMVEFAAGNYNQDLTTHWHPFFQARYLYFEIVIMNEDESAAIGGDTYFHKIDFEVMVMPASGV